MVETPMGGGGGGVEKWRLKLSSAKVEVEVEAELGNIISRRGEEINGGAEKHIKRGQRKTQV